MMNRYYSIAFLSVLLNSLVTAQQLKPDDHYTIGGSGSDQIWDIAIDDVGNQYLCGYFSGTVDFDPGPSTYNLSTVSGHTQPDAFIVKLDTNGDFEWAVKIGGGNSDAPQVARRVKLDNQGNIYVAGYFRTNIRFTPNGLFWYTNVSSNEYSAFLAKLAPDGTVLWGRGWETNDDLFIWDIDFDSQNDVYCAGSFKGSCDFDPIDSPNNVEIRNSSGNNDMFLLKLDSNGNFKRIRKTGSTGNDLFGAIEITQFGEIYLSGSFSDTVDLMFGQAISNYTSSGIQDGFIMKMDTAINYKWIKTFGASGIVWSRNLVVKDSVLYHAGVFEQGIDLDPGSSSFPAYSSGSTDIFIQKLDTAGSFIWGQTLGGTQHESVMGLAVNSNHEIIFTGTFLGTVDFNPDPLGVFSLSPSGGADGFVCSLNSNGDFLTAAKYGGNSQIGVLEYMTCAAIDANESFYIGGYFSGSLDIDPTSGYTQVVSSGSSDMLMIKLGSCMNQHVKYSANVCGNKYVLPNGTIVYQSGYYLSSIYGNQGCDSLIGITLILNPLPDTTVTQTGATFTAQPGLSYQWYNCQTNQSIAGETNQSFTAISNGQYAVIVSNGTCIDTSACFALNNIGMQEVNLPFVNIYPNPTNGLLHIQSGKPWQSVSVIDVSGSVLLVQQHAAAEIDLGTLPAGIYVVKVIFEEGVMVSRVVKK